MSSATPQPWTIVLAAGNGTRLHSLTRALHGEDLPKQFARIQNDRSLLQATVSRVAQWSSPARTIVVVAREREQIARAQLKTHGEVNLVLQPRNRGTGPGILFPLTHILAEDPAAQVIILPSDHYVRNEETFAESVRRAEASSRCGDSIVLVGAVPDHAETQYGWIVPKSEDTSGKMAVARFHEKPDAPLAERLLGSGALWNTFILAGAAQRLWDLGRRHLPEQSSLLELYGRAIGTARESQVLTSLYDRMSPADFSRDILEKADGLGVVKLDACGWSDWGTPDRVMRSLMGSSELSTLVSRLRTASSQHPAKRFAILRPPMTLPASLETTAAPCP